MSLLFFFSSFRFSSSLAAEAKKLKVVTTLSDFASLAQTIGGDRVEAESIAKGYQDPHFVEPKPSFILKLHDADMLIVAGLELEIGYLPPLLDQARNEKIRPTGRGLPRRLRRVRHPRQARRGWSRARWVTSTRTGTPTTGSTRTTGA